MIQKPRKGQLPDRRSSTAIRRLLALKLACASVRAPRALAELDLPLSLVAGGEDLYVGAYESVLRVERRASARHMAATATPSPSRPAAALIALYPVLKAEAFFSGFIGTPPFRLVDR